MTHSLGVFHQHSRPDRDEHIVIDHDNVIDDFLQEFDVKSSKEYTTFGIPYTYKSVMHYGNKVFTVSIRISSLPDFVTFIIS